MKPRMRMLLAFLRSKKGVVLEAVMAAQMIREEWGVQADWHEMSEALEHLVQTREAEATGQTRERFITYLVL